MEIRKLSLRDFRNIRELELEPHPGVNIVYGNNAQGKTNLMEAIWLLTGQKSFRQTRESDFVRFGQGRGEISARFFASGREQEAKLLLAGGKRSASLNGIPAAVGELTGRFFAVVFSPTELSLVKEGPSLRRAFLDGAISQVMPRYLRTLSDLGRVTFQRNSLLSDMARFPSLDEGLLEVWDRSFARLSYSILHARLRYLRRLDPFAREIYRGISGGKEELSLRYLPSVEGDWLELSEEEGVERILAALEGSRREDLRNGFTTLGPHRDDLEILVGGISARAYGSQGQQRSCALTLKLAECRVIREVSGEEPVVLLDDVLSELDKTRRDYFLSGLAPGQLFITCCDRAGFASIRDGITWRIRDGALAGTRRLAPRPPREEGGKPPPGRKGKAPPEEKPGGKPKGGKARAPAPGGKGPGGKESPRDGPPGG